MKIKWLGHSCFLITTEAGVKILTDPYKSGSYEGAVGYGKIEEPADIVLVSHEHEDHNSVESVPGSPVVIRGPGQHESKDIEFKGVATYHDRSQGRERGENTVFVFETDGIRVCHLGDLGHTVSKEHRSSIGEVDILLVPVGGFYTIDAAEATDVVETLDPGMVIPMHYKTDKLGFAIAGVDGFLEGKKGVKRQGSPEIEIVKVEGERQVVVLDHAM